MLYVADNPRSCPTVEALVDERYLDASYLDGVDVGDTGIRCRKGDIDVYAPGPPPPAAWMRLRQWLCGGLRVGATVWALPFRLMVEGWRAAAELFV